MDITLLPNMRQSNDGDFPNWSKIQNLIPSSIPNVDLLDYAQNHESTKSKVTFADYHYYILDQLYKPHVTDRESDTVDSVLAEFHSIVIDLYSALDSLSYEINLAYNFGLRSNQIHVYHNHNPPKPDCFRCNLDKQSDALTSFINTKLNNQWFQTFNKLRNQITHKSLPVIHVDISVGSSTTKLKIPDDPTNTNPQYGDYSQDLEINQFCKDLRRNTVELIEQVYSLIEPKIRIRYNL
jgi:hypothetical protein